MSYSSIGETRLVKEDYNDSNLVKKFQRNWKKGFKIINKTPLPVICFMHPKESDVSIIISD